MVICNATGAQSSPQLVSDGTGGAIIVWEDYRDWYSNGSDIYGQHMNSLGETQWANKGVVICNNSYMQSSPKLASDGTGGAIIIWDDGRNLLTLYCQDINSHGALQWAADGISICSTTDGYLGSPQIMSDGAGGAVIAWDDGRCQDWNIYCQRINNSGTPQWSTDGEIICNKAEWQQYPQLIADGAGGMIITWVDKRGGSWGDIYGQNMIRPRPRALSINSPALIGELFHAAITGHWFKDDRGSVVDAKLTREGSTDIPLIAGTLLVQDANRLTCDFDLSSAGPGYWSLVITDSLSQSSANANILTILAKTPTSTMTPVCSSTPTVTATVTSTPTPISGKQNISVGHYIYITNDNAGLQIYDNSDPSHPQLVHSIPGNWKIYVKDFYLYMVDGQGTLYSYDLHDPGHPRELNPKQTGGQAIGIDGIGNYVLVADGQNGVAIFDVSIVSDICLKDRVKTPGSACDVRVAVNEKLAYGVLSDGNQWPFDISGYLSSPTLRDGGYATPNPFLPLRNQKAFFNFRFENPTTAYSIRIYNLRGQLQRTLKNSREWDGHGESGHLCEGGVYVYQIEAEDKRISGKVVLIK